MNIIIKVILLVLFINSIISFPQDDKIVGLPGYPSTFTSRIFAGYLNTNSNLRQLHYIFLQNAEGISNTAPIVMWMNGGPGCSSKLGLLQQIGPYILPIGTEYKSDDPLTANQKSWFYLANLLFIDSPAGVGFSKNNDANFQYNDQNTALDNLQAIKYFFQSKFPEYISNDFYLAGQSYAAKYIPDLAIKIYHMNNNSNNHNIVINLRGLLIGNGLLNFQNNILQKQQIQFMIKHNFIDPKLQQIWSNSCKLDYQSARCKYFYSRYNDLTNQLNFHNLYGSCYPNDYNSNNNNKKNKNNKNNQNNILSQKYILNKIIKKSSNFQNNNNFNFQIHSQRCQFIEGIQQYFLLNYKIFNTDINNFALCNKSIYNNYIIQSSGNMNQLPILLNLSNIRIYLYSADCDAIIPWTSIIKNIQLLSLKQISTNPWFVDNQHAGFIKKYPSKLQLYQIKAVGHQVPLYSQSKAYKLFSQFLFN